MSILVYPVGIVSTTLYILIMLRAKLYGDALVNVVYTAMSVYGWIRWSSEEEVQPRYASRRELAIGGGLVAGGLAVVLAVYSAVGDPINWADAISTAIFGVAMWYMALQTIESWALWLVGDVVSTWKVATKGLYFTAFQYTVLCVMAVYGWIEWRELSRGQKEPGELEEGAELDPASVA